MSTIIVITPPPPAPQDPQRKSKSKSKVQVLEVDDLPGDTLADKLRRAAESGSADFAKMEGWQPQE